jgi:hypothetical protein
VSILSTPTPTIPAQSTISSASSSISIQRTATPAFKIFRNEKVGFQIKYPPDYADAVQSPGIQGWTFSDDWNVVDFSKLNHTAYFLIVFPFSGTLDALQTVRNKIPTTSDYLGLVHPTVPMIFADVTKTLVKTFTIDGYPARWYKTGSRNTTDSSTANEVHFIARNHGFIFTNDMPALEENPYFSVEEMNSIISSFTFIK